MAAVISVYDAVVLTIDGEPYSDVGSLVVPVKGSEASIGGGTNPIERRVLVPAGQKVTAWEWADTSGFQFVRAAIRGGEGYVQVAVRYNSPTSSTDLTPTGSTNHWKERGMSCFGVFQMDTERAYIHATAASEVGQTANYPTVWSDGSRVLGVADVLAFFNEGTDDVVVDLLVVPK